MANRAPLVLCYLQGETQDEAARRLGLPKGTLKGRLERARELLRARLVKRGLGPAALLAAVSMPLAAQASLPPATLSATAKAASLAAAGSLLVGVVSEPVLRLMEGVLQAMFIAKIRVASLGLLACIGALAFTVLAAGQTLGPKADDPPAKQAPKAGFGKVQRLALSPDALATHLGVTHKSFELSFDPAPAELELSIDVYENGKLAKQGEKVASLPQTKKHACSVLFSHTPGHPKLILTVATPGSTFHTQIDDPFPGFGQIFPDPVLDANGRIVLALRPARNGEALPIENVTLANAEKALVVQVHRK